MDDPVREIPGVIAALTQGHSEDQVKALEDYFLPDAYFMHPFCRVPSFRDFALPFPLPFLTGSSSQRTVNSRRLVLMVYEWYRILSPKIVFSIESIAFDQRASLLYLTIRQKFTLWFVPFDLWQANVKLVTVLELAALPVDEDNHPRTLAAAAVGRSNAGNGNSTVATTAATATNSAGDHNEHHHYDTSPVSRTRFFIQGQEDHYQVEEWLKFIAPWGASLLWVAWQLLATGLCAFGVLLWPFGLVRAVKRRQRQRRELRDKQQRENKDA